MLIGGAYGAAIFAAVIWLAINAQAEGERNLLIGILGGGFGGAVQYFLGNLNVHRQGTGTGSGSGPTINVDTQTADVTATQEGKAP
jgi:hypothetical protein